MIVRTLLALLLALPLLSHPAFGDVTTIGWWRLGEDDPGALDAAQAQNPTVATTGSFPLSWDSATNGNAFYRSDTAPGKRLRLATSILAIEIDDNAPYPGYHSATLPSTATTNIGLEIWAKANEDLVQGANPSDILIWNGETPDSGYGIIQQNNTWGAALRLTATSTFTLIATAPLTTGVWTHLALVESSGTWKFYVNGKEAGSLASAAKTPAFRFNLGESYSALDQGFDGFLDEARIFSFAPGAFTTSDLNYVVFPPVVTKAKPSPISLKPGTKVTVTGNHLLATSSATLGKRPVKGLQRVNDTTLRFRVPKGLKASLKKVPFTVVSEEGSATKLLKVKSED